MVNQFLINPEHALAILRERVTQEMEAAAEPLIQEFLKKAETAMRQELAKNVIALIETRMDVYRGNNSIDIRILLDPNRPDR